jgi:hypothetical protein
MIRTVRATRYVTPLREGGSLPAIVEGDDLGLYVLKFRGAGQGPLVLVAELIAGEIGRSLGLNVPEIVFMDVDSALGRNEPDEEVRDLLRASIGLNLGLDYLPGSVMFDPAAGDTADPGIASKAVWFDALVCNVDRTPMNPNLLYWHRQLYFIDHGAALYFHFDWSEDIRGLAGSPFPMVQRHVLLPWASEIDAVHPSLASQLDGETIERIVCAVPEEWLTTGRGGSAHERRQAYIEYFEHRREAAPIFVEEALRARAQLV